MMQRHTIGPGVLVIALLLGAAMMLVTFLLQAGATPLSDAGSAIPFSTILPPPEDWGVSPLAGAAIGAGVAGMLAVGMQLLNKRLDFIPGTELVMPSMVFLLTAATPALSGALNGAMAVGIASFLSMALAMGCYRKANSTQEIFVAATVISLGTMIEWGCLLLVVWCPLAWGIMKALRFKELMAFLLGLAAPWWCVFGLGLVPFDTLLGLDVMELLPSAPSLGAQPMLVAVTAWWAFVAILIGLNAAVKLYAGNSRIRSINNVVNLLGVFCLVAMAIDYREFEVYLLAFWLTVAVQTAQLFAQWSLPRPRVCAAILILLCTAQYILLIS